MSWENITGFAPLWSPEKGDEIDAFVQSVRETDFGNQYTVRLTVPHDLMVFVKDDGTGNDGAEKRHFDKGSLLSLPSHKMLTNNDHL